MSGNEAICHECSESCVANENQTCPLNSSQDPRDRAPGIGHTRLSIVSDFSLSWGGVKHDLELI